MELLAEVGQRHWLADSGAELEASKQPSQPAASKHNRTLIFLPSEDFKTTLVDLYIIVKHHTASVDDDLAIPIGQTILIYNIPSSVFVIDNKSYTRWNKCVQFQMEIVCNANICSFSLSHLKHIAVKSCNHSLWYSFLCKSSHSHLVLKTSPSKERKYNVFPTRSEDTRMLQ